MAIWTFASRYVSSKARSAQIQISTVSKTTVISFPILTFGIWQSVPDGG